MSEGQEGNLKNDNLKNREEWAFEAVKNVKQSDGSYHEISKEIIRQYGIGTEIETGHMYWYDGKRYKFDGKQKVRNIAQNIYNVDSSNHKVREIEKATERNSYIYRDNLFDLEPHKIVVKNGVLNLKDGSIEEFKDVPGKRNGTKIALDIKWNPENREKECKQILEFLKTLIPNSNDVQKILEGIGHCLYRDWIDHKAFMFLGGGANGKSTLLEIITDILGDEYVSHVPLQKVNHRFSAASLDGKLANICADLPDRALKTTGMFKMLTGEDRIRAERKYENAYAFRNKAKMFFSCNELPETQDTTDAFFRRWEIIEFPKTFKGEDADPHIKQKLTTKEMREAWLYLIVDAFQQLYNRGNFLDAGTTKDVKERWIRESNPYVAFVKDYIEKTNNEGDFISRDELKSRYREEVNGDLRPKKLYKAVRTELNPNEGQKRGEGRGFHQIKFKSDENEISQHQKIDESISIAKNLMEQSVQAKFQRGKLKTELMNKLNIKESTAESTIQTLVKEGRLIEPQKGYLRLVE